MSGRAPLTVKFTDTSTSISCGITSWFWDFGDGSTADGRGPWYHTYVYAPAPYIVTLTVKNAAGSTTLGGVEILVKP
jgi:PKD repeat protein